MAWGGSRGGGTPASPVGSVRGTLLALTPSETRRCVLWTGGGVSEAWPPSGLAPSGWGPRGHSWSSSCFCAAPSLPFVVLPAFSFPLGGGEQQLPKGWLGLATALRATYGPQLILWRAACPSPLPPPTGQMGAAPRAPPGRGVETLAVPVVVKASGTGAVGGRRCPLLSPAAVLPLSRWPVPRPRSGRRLSFLPRRTDLL